jgi:hypothetical protein
MSNFHSPLGLAVNLWRELLDAVDQAFGRALFHYQNADPGARGMGMGSLAHSV